MLLFGFPLLERRISYVSIWASSERSGGRDLDHRVERFELADQVSQPAGRLFGTRPGRAVTKRSRLRLACEAQRFAQVFTDGAELLQLDGPHALGSPRGVEGSADPDEIAERFERNSGVALCQPLGVEAPLARGVKVLSQALEGAMVSSRFETRQGSWKKLLARSLRFCGCRWCERRASFEGRMSIVVRTSIERV